jgi:exodeoxyribonuclease VII small subunit
MTPRERTTAPTAPGDAPFETSLARLEAIVDELESGELDLEASLARFEEGVALSRRCAGQLAEARQRIDVLVRENGELLERPFEPEPEDGA